MSADDIPVDPQAFAAWMNAHGATTTPIGVHPSQVRPLTLSQIRAGMEEFKNLQTEVADVLASFKADLQDQHPTLNEDDITFFHRIWSVAYLNLVWAQVQVNHPTPGAGQ